MTEHVSILNGKAAKYNIAILKALYTKGPLASPWYIAKEIVQETGGKTQNVYSVLIRRGGRLENLRELGYVVENFDFITISHKGVFALLIHNPSLFDKISPDLFAKLKAEEPGGLASIPDSFTTPLGLKVNGLREAITKAKHISELSTPTGFLKTSKIVEELIREGINLDVITNENLSALIALKMKQTRR